MKKMELQPYPRIEGGLLSHPDLFPMPSIISDAAIDGAIQQAFQRSKLNKRGALKKTVDTPEKLVHTCITHLRERSDPILSPSFVSQCTVKEIFELDAVSHEMQRHRMSIGVFYQYLLLELLYTKFGKGFDGSGEDDITVDIDPRIEDFNRGLRLYISVKKSSDTVGGQDVGGAIRRLEDRAKQEKNLTRPYLCILCIATPSRGRIATYEKDRKIKYNKSGSPYSMNCETWGPGFIFPYLTGHIPNYVYAKACQYVAQHFPFMSLKYRNECAALLAEELRALGLLGKDDKIDSNKFLEFCSHAK